MSIYIGVAHGSGSSPLYEHVDVVLSTIHEVVFEVWSQKTRDLCYAFVLKILGHSLELSPKYLASSFLKSSWLQDLSDPNLAFVCNSLRPASIHSATAFRYHISYSLATSSRPPLPASPYPASHPPCIAPTLPAWHPSLPHVLLPNPRFAALPEKSAAPQKRQNAGEGEEYF